MCRISSTVVQVMAKFKSLSQSEPHLRDPLCMDVLSQAPSISTPTPGKLALRCQSLPRVDLRNRYCVRPDRHGYSCYKRAQQFSKTLFSQLIAMQGLVRWRKTCATEAGASREAVVEALNLVWPSAAEVCACPAAAWSTRTTRLAQANDE